MKTFSLPEVADMALPDEWTDGARWLARRIRRGEISGYRCGHKLRMTEDQVKDMIARYTEGAAPTAGPQQQPIAVHRAQDERPMRVVDGLSARSRRRLNRSA